MVNSNIQEATWNNNKVKFVQWDGLNIDIVKEFVKDHKIYRSIDKEDELYITGVGLVEKDDYICKDCRYIYDNYRIYSWKVFPRLIKEDIGSGLDKYTSESNDDELTIKLPCKEGTTCYRIVDDCNYYDKCPYSEKSCNGCKYRDLHVEPQIFATKYQIVLEMEQFNKTIFLSEDAANQMLANMVNPKTHEKYPKLHEQCNKYPEIQLNEQCNKYPEIQLNKN